MSKENDEILIVAFKKIPGLRDSFLEFLEEAKSVYDLAWEQKPKADPTAEMWYLAVNKEASRALDMIIVTLRELENTMQVN